MTGQKDFQWEARYVIGGLSPKEYRQLKKTQPSYRDTYQMLGIVPGEYSRWMMFLDEDIPVLVKRVSDGKQFVLGMCEIEATDRKSKNDMLINEYTVWLVSTR